MPLNAGLHYSYLRPGEYTFNVTAVNSDGVWNNTGAMIRIVVVPGFIAPGGFFLYRPS